MDSTEIAPLDLYARVEDLLGIQAYAPKLYAHYLLFLQEYITDSLLDVGCGSGEFLYQMQEALAIPTMRGIDLSPLMVSSAAKRGLKVEARPLCEVTQNYQTITAVFDMLNYLDKEALKDFLVCVSARLEKGGFFLCDINTLYGFENVAVGSFIVDDDTRFLTIDSDFEEGVYTSEFTLFDKVDTGYTKSQETIRQYYHTLEDIIKLSGLVLVSDDAVNLYDFDEADKRFVVLQKV